jgi:tRNA threonylcarbamoyladenosine biosynthesis protein TsaE
MSPSPGPVTVSLPDADAARVFGLALADLLRAGDVLVLTGDLGAGKTTLTQGIGAGLGVRGPITSPTFVIARVHPSLVGGPALVHVDAYRLGGAVELDDLDLDADLDASVVVVEWGHGVAEQLSADRLEVVLQVVGPAQTRTATLRATGERWATPAVASALVALAERDRPATGA